MPAAVGALGALAGAFSTAAGAIGAGLAGEGVLGGILGTAVFKQLAASVALSVLARVLQKEPDRLSGTGSTVSMKFGETTYDFFGMGKWIEAGQLWYHNSWDNGGDDTPNEYYVQVIKLGTLPAKLRRAWVNGEWVTLRGGGLEMFEHADAGVGLAVEGYEKDGEDRLFIKFYDGTQTKADDYLLEKFGDDPDRPWTEDMVGWGCPYIIVTAGLRGDVHRARPQVRIELDRSRWYDPRKDSSKGGRGTQRWSKPKTWKPTENPVVMIYNIIRGVYDPVNGDYMWGGVGMGAENFNRSMWFAAMNACDVEVDTSVGKEPRYRAGIRISMEEEPATVVEELLKCCHGRIAFVGNEWQITAGPFGGSVWTYNDDDVLVTSARDLRPFIGISESYNGVRSQYPEPGSGYEMRDVPERLDEEFLKEDKGYQNVVSLSFRGVPHRRQVQRLARGFLRDNRRFISHVHVVPPEARKVGPLDVVTMNSVENGYESKKFTLEYIEDLENGSHIIVTREINPEDYDFNIGNELPDVPKVPKNPRKPPRAINIDVSPTSIKDHENNDRAPAILLEWDAKQGISALRIQVRLKGNPNHIPVDVRSSRKDPSQENYVLRANSKTVKINGRSVTFYRITWVKREKAWISGRRIVPGEDYQVRAIPEPIKGWRWSDWHDVSTPPVKINRRDIEAKTLTTREIRMDGRAFNKVPDDQLQAPEAWELDSGYVVSPIGVNDDADSRGMIEWRQITAPGFFQAHSDEFPINKDQKLVCFYQVQRRRTTVTTRTAKGRARLVYFNKNGVEIGTSAAIGGDFDGNFSHLMKKRGIITDHPAGAKTAKWRFVVEVPGTTDDVYFYSPSVWRKSALSDIAEADDDFIEDLQTFSDWVEAEMVAPGLSVAVDVVNNEDQALTGGTVAYINEVVNVPAGGRSAVVLANLDTTLEGGWVEEGNWDYRLQYDAPNTQISGGIASSPSWQSTVSLMGRINNLSAGNHNIKVRVTGNSTITIRRGTLIVFLFK